MLPPFVQTETNQKKREMRKKLHQSLNGEILSWYSTKWCLEKTADIKKTCPGSHC